MQPLTIFAHDGSMDYIFSYSHLMICSEKMRHTNGSQVADVASGRTFEIVKSDSFPDAVVWNPWRDKSIKMADFGDEEFKDMLCIEPAVASSGPFKLGPGETWVGSQTISYRHNKPERVSIDGAVL